MEKLLIGIHTGIAALSGEPGWLLGTDSTPEFDNQSEARFLSKSAIDVLGHYKPDFIDQKTVDWCLLIQALALVYGTRVAAMWMRPSAKASGRGRPQAQPQAPQEPPQTFAWPGAAQPDQKMNGAEARQEHPPPTTGIIPGLGPIDFPADHPLVRKPN